MRVAVGRDVKGSYGEKETWRWRGGRGMSGAAVTGGRGNLGEQKILRWDERAEGRREAEEAPGPWRGSQPGLARDCSQGASQTYWSCRLII